MNLPVRPYKFYCGVDPGSKGALAVMSADGAQMRVWDMPFGVEGELDLPGLADVFKRIKIRGDVAVGIEWPTAWPGAFSNVIRDAEVFGRQKGYLEAFSYLHGFDTFRLSPQLWKGRLGLDGKAQDKGSARAAALWDTFYPERHALVRGPRGGLRDGRLDALLMAHLMRTRTGEGMRSIVAKFGKDSAEALAFILGGGRRKKKQWFET